MIHANNKYAWQRIYLPRQFLTIFLFFTFETFVMIFISTHTHAHIYFLKSYSIALFLLNISSILFFFSPLLEKSPRSGRTTERWKCVLSICTVYVASDATRTRCHVDAHLSVKAVYELCSLPV